MPACLTHLKPGIIHLCVIHLYIYVHFGFLLSAALQSTPISEPALFRNDVHRGKGAPSRLSMLNDTLQRKDALHRSSQC